MKNNLKALEFYLFDGEGYNLWACEKTKGVFSVSYNGEAKNVVIPEFIQEKRITRLDISFMEGNEFIETVTLPDSIEIIDNYAFAYCTNLKEIHFGANTTRIGTGAFIECKNLKNITFPDTILSIGKDAFNSCVNLEELILPKNLIKIGKRAFNSCRCIRTLEISNQLEKIGEEAFCSLFLIKSIRLPKSLKEIGKGAFSDCIYLKTANFENAKISYIPRDCFAFCTSLKKVLINKKVIRIESRAFKDCFQLELIDYRGSGRNWFFTYKSSTCKDKWKTIKVKTKEEMTSL